MTIYRQPSGHYLVNKFEKDKFVLWAEENLKSFEEYIIEKRSLLPMTPWNFAFTISDEYDSMLLTITYDVIDIDMNMFNPYRN